jgi:hypothetical protein
MLLLGLLIPLGVGVLSAMELSAPPRSEVAAVEPVAEATAVVPDSHDGLAKGDRLDVAAASSETPVQPDLIGERISPPKDVHTDSTETPKPIKRHRHASGSRKVTAAARPKSKPKAAATKPADIKRTAISRRSMPATDAQPCRLKAFGGLLKALDSTDCEI